MKRITYISHFAYPLSSEEIARLGEVTLRNNARDNITGVLICSAGVFFQTIEGDDEKIDKLFEKIKRDRRHTDILCLRTENDVSERQYPEWSMKTLNLDEDTDVLMYPIRSLFQVLAESHGVLEKYTQPTVLDFISSGINPLTIPSRETRKVIVFCDIVAFSRFTVVLSVQEIVSMVNAYLSICSNAIVKRHGEVAKYIGDCVMAYFDYENVDLAIQAGLDILADLKKVREDSPKGSPLRLLYTGIGMACGEVIEGNIGSVHKTEYTVLGDAVNQAAFLENLTRDLPRSMVLSLDVRKIASPAWSFLPLGEFDMKRGRGPIPVFSVDDPVTLSLVDPNKIIQATEGI